MKYDRLTFIESINELSTLHNIKLQYNEKKQENLYQLMHNLSIYYNHTLTQKKYTYAYEYLRNRGLNENTISIFNIGFAPPHWNNIIKKFGLAPSEQKLLNQSGMLIEHKKHKYDRFRNRIMFPIRNKLGKTIAFGGRSIISNDNTTPKYLNSPDTEIFKKNQHLYGLYEIYTNTKNTPYLLLVEGYIDVIILTQFGIKYTVASLGTSISHYHIQLMYSITDHIICCYDGDHPGEKAAWNILNMVLPYLTDNHQISFMFLPKGEDPDTLIQKIGKKNFIKKIEKAQNLSYFLFNTLSNKINLQTLENKIKISNLLIPIINKIPGKTLKMYLLQQLGNRIGILDENKLHKLLQNNNNRLSTNNSKTIHNIKCNVENTLISLLLQNPKLVSLIPIEHELTQSQNKEIVLFADLIQKCRKYSISTTAQLLEFYRDNKLFFKLEKLAYWNHLITNNMIEIIFIDTLTKLYNLILEERQNTLIEQDRISKLTKAEQQELWLLNKTLSKYHI